MASTSNVEVELRVFIPEWIGEKYAEQTIRGLLEDAGFLVLEYETV